MATITLIIDVSSRSPGGGLEAATDVNVPTSDRLARLALLQLEAFQSGTIQPRQDAHQVLVAERTPAIMVPNFLSAAEVGAILEAAEAMVTFEEHAAFIRSTNISPFGHHTAFSESHVALHMHRCNYFGAHLPALLSKLTTGMCSHFPHMCDPAALRVRCIEAHAYAKGGGLMTDGHKDYGSVLTMSILLSHADEMGGGTLHTWHEGLAVPAAMERGSALIFPSLKTHNVSPITFGKRMTLVVELWTGPTNQKTRFE